MDFDRHSLRHAVATLSYRAAKTMRGAPESFADFKVAPATKAPVEIVAHLGDLFDWALRMARGEMKWTTAKPQAWPAECARFFTAPVHQVHYPGRHARLGQDFHQSRGAGRRVFGRLEHHRVAAK